MAMIPRTSFLRRLRLRLPLLGRPDRRGVTMVEVMMTASIMAIMVLAIIPLFNSTQKGYTALEVNTVLAAGGQQAVNKIQHRLVECKRLFGNTTADTAFLSRVQFSGAPTAMTGSKLPLIVSTASISPSTTAFNAGNVGNSLFFASLDTPLTLTNISDGTSTHTVKVDIYVFNYYYLSTDTAKSIGGQPTRNLWEWHSRKYADWVQLNNISNSTKRTNTGISLYNNGVIYAWDTSATSVSSAFYTISSGGSISASSSHNIVKSTATSSFHKDSAKNMVVLIRGVTSGGFRYGISPNTSSSFAPRDTVPRFATAASNFPSGFETMIVGANSARQVFIRLVLAAEGSFKGAISYEQVVLTTSRDLW